MGIEKALAAHFPSVHIKIFSLYPSGFLYSFLRNIPSSCISFRVWTNTWIYRKRYRKLIEKTHFKGLNLNELIVYQLQHNKRISEKNLLLQAVSYIDFIDKKLQRFQPNLVLCVGDSRLMVDVVTRLAHQQNIPVYFIEQGPYGTTVFDPKGVNANAGIRDFQFENAEKPVDSNKIKNFVKRPKGKKYSRSPIYRGIDYALEYLLKNTRFYPPDLKMDFPLRRKYDLCGKAFQKQHFSLEKNYGKTVYLLVCQVPFDVNMTHHSPHYDNHSSILKDVFENLPENAVLVVREHPLCRGKYEKEFYDFIREKPIFIDCQKSVAPVFEKVDVVVVNNSTVGLEAISNHKPVVVLGNSYYDHPNLCLKLTEKENLKKILLQAKDFMPDEKDINAFLHKFLFNYLIEGYITDKDLTAAKSIAKKISQEFQPKSL